MRAGGEGEWGQWLALKCMSVHVRVSGDMWARQNPSEPEDGPFSYDGSLIGVVVQPLTHQNHQSRDLSGAGGAAPN